MVVSLLSFRVATAEPTTITGRVIDVQGTPVRGAAVSVEGATETVTTDREGRYTITGVEPGASLIVIADGYGAGLGNAAPRGEDIVLLAEAQASETIEVKGERAPQAHGAATLDRKQLQRMAGAGNDVMRAVSAMPGVASYPLPLGNSGVVIRGSSPQDSKVLIDDFEVPMLYHYVGFRSVIPSEAIDTLDYVPGGFDVAYGRATSGIVSLTTRAGDAKRGQQFESSAGEIGALGQGTFGTRGRYMIAFRRSMVDLFLPLLLPDGLDLALTTVPRFYDGQTRIDYALSERWTLRVSAIGSDDAMEVYASRDKNADKRFLNRGRFLRMTASAHYHSGSLTAKLAVSGIAQQSTFERGLHQHLDVTSPALTTRAEVATSAAEYAGLKDVAWRTGVETVTTRHAIDLAAPRERREGEPPAPDDPMDRTVKYTGKVDTANVALWSHVSGSLDERVKFGTGLRVDAYTQADDVAVQPRGEIQVKITRPLSARVAAAAFSRPAEHQTELVDPTLKAERSRQLMGGLMYQPIEGLRLQGSLYYTHRSNLITRDAMGELANDGSGASYGGELLAQLDRGPLFGWLSYAYSHSTREDVPGGSTRLFDYDQPHNLNAAASYKIGRWQFGARFRLHSGLPATPVVDATYDSDANLYYPVYGTPNSDRAPMHHQLDLRIDRTSKWGPVKITQFLDVQNVYLNDSVVGYFYGFDYSQRAAFRTLPILPTAGLRGEF